MKIVCLLMFLLILWITGPVGFAQSKKNDVLVKIDNTRIQCRIISVDETVIRYRNLSGKTIQRINKNLVSRIVYANYLIPLSRTINLDAGLFYRAAVGSKTLKTSYGVYPMQYVRIRLGMEFSH